VETSIRNHLKGKIKDIVLGQVVSEVEIETPAGIIASVITSRSVKRLNLKAGDEVYAVIKATAVSVEKQ
jgi:molybdopterin-binding protein